MKKYSSLKNCANKSLAKRFIIPGCLVGLLALFLVVTYWFKFGNEAYLSANPRSVVNYQQFKPTALPRDFAITSEFLYIKSGTSGAVNHPVAKSGELNLLLSSSEGSGAVVELAPNDFNSKQVVCQQSLSSDETCKLHSTPKSQEYSITTKSAQDSKTSRQTATLVRSGTVVQILINYANVAALTAEEWGVFIDSFAPASFDDVEITYSF